MNTPNSSVSIKSLRHIFRSKINALSLAMLLTLTAFMQIPNLNAGGWGVTEEVIDFQDAIWNRAFFDMNDLYFTVLMPHYQSTQLKNGRVMLYGNVGDSGYLIITTFNSGFTPPDSSKKFLKIVQGANPEFVASEVKSKKLGAKYAVDLVPASSVETTFWRFLSTEDRLIQMGTDDTNEKRRQKFFDSMHIY